MTSKYSGIFLISAIACLTLIWGSSSQNNPNNYVKLINHAHSIKYEFIRDVADFSQLHSTPLGPLSDFLGLDWCYKGAHTRYSEINYGGNIIHISSKREEICLTGTWKGYNSLRLLGSAELKLVHLYTEERTVGPQLSYNVDMANITLPNTNSLLVVGAGVSATFYTQPNYGGASVCVSVGTNPDIFFSIIYNTTFTFGFNTIRSIKFGCNSKKMFTPFDSTILDIIN